MKLKWLPPVLHCTNQKKLWQEERIEKPSVKIPKKEDTRFVNYSLNIS